MDPMTLMSSHVVFVYLCSRALVFVFKSVGVRVRYERVTLEHYVLGRSSLSFDHLDIELFGYLHSSVGIRENVEERWCSRVIYKRVTLS